MSRPTITTLPTPPQKTDPVNFAQRADAFLIELPGWGDEVNASGVWFEAQMDGIDADKLATQGYKDDAETARDATVTFRDAALASANYAGTWDSLTGAQTDGISVHHSDMYWMLLESVADVTLEEPGESAKWAAIGGTGKPFGNPDWPVTLSYTDGILTQAVYARANVRYRQILNYTDDVLTSVAYAVSLDSGTTYGNIGTETLNYTDSVLTSTSWTPA